MAHVGREYPLHWRRDMSLNVGNHRFGWPMYCKRNFSGFHIPDVVTSGQLTWYGISTIDWVGLSMLYIGKLVTRYGRSWQLAQTMTYVEGCSRIEVSTSVSNNIDGLVLHGSYRHTIPNQSWGWFGIYRLSDCLQPAKFRPWGTEIIDNADIPTWAGFRAEFPGQDPWKPPVP